MNAAPAEQSAYPKDYFQAPVHIPMYLAGNFGELRSNHFHAGLDIKTQGKEGIPVFAAADGEVSRIKIGLGGYGKALYVDHPNGYTTVYAHLQGFDGAIAEYVRKAQYAQKSFTIELFPEPGELPVTQNQLVALSGNTGGSGGPHLHFEIRETESEIPVNPLLFGFKIKDNVKPILRRLALYPLSDSSRVDNSETTKFIEVGSANGQFQLSQTTPIKVAGAFGVGLEVIDKMNGTSNRNGVYSIELRCDDRRIYYHEMEKISFDESRYINSHTDYSQKIVRRRWVQKSFLQPNNRLSIYREVAENGRLVFQDEQVHSLSYIVKDAYGNTSRLNFKVQAAAPAPISKARVNKNLVARFRYDRENHYQGEDFRVHLPEGVLYDHLPFEYHQTAPPKGGLAPTHHIHYRTVPLQSYIKLALRIPENLSDKQLEKAFIVSLKGNGSVLSYKGGTVEGDFISTQTKTLGAFSIAVDTLPPVLRPVNISAGADLSSSKQIVIEIYDALAGLKDFDGYIDGEWVLMEYDRKSRRLTFDFSDHKISSGRHTFELRLSDRRDNERHYKTEFVR